MTSHPSTLSHVLPPRYPFPSSIVVGDGSLLPVTITGATVLPGSLSLNNVLVSPRLIKNLISVRQFTSDNNCSVEFDPAGCSVKDLASQRVLSGAIAPVRCIRCSFPRRLLLLQLLRLRCGTAAVVTPVMMSWQKLLQSSRSVIKNLAPFVMSVS